MSAITLLTEHLKEHMLNTDNLMLLRLETQYSELVPRLSKYIMNSGGKRIRQLLTLASAECVSAANINTYNLASSIELLHTATLLHDDVIDNSATRRGKPTANLIWDNRATILVGDFLFGQAFKCMVETNLLECMEVLSRAVCVITESEVWQIEAIGNTNFSEADYMKLIEYKTASLFEAACKVGAISGNATEEERALMSMYGRCFGIAFQILDDVLDYTSTAEQLKKPIGGDFYESKVTLPVIFALKRASKSDLQALESLIREKSKEPEHLLAITELLNKYDAFNASVDVAKKHGLLAVEFLSSIKKSNVREVLENVAIEYVNTFY